MRLRGNAPNWERASCLGTAPVRQPGESEVYDPWFDEDDPGPALDVCNAPACPIRDACLKFALFNNEKFGVWGGMSETDRKVMRRIWRWSSGLDAPREEWTWREPEQLALELQEHLRSARSVEEPEEDDD